MMCGVVGKQRNNIQGLDVSVNGGFLAEKIIYIIITLMNLPENSVTENSAQY
jgi:hypothetical protein